MNDLELLAGFIDPIDADAEWLRKGIYGWYYMIGAWLRPAIIGEIGVRLGYSLIAMAKGSRAAGGPELQVYGWDNETYVAGCLAKVRERTAELFRADLTCRNTAEIESLGISGIDLFHVDGDHTEAGAYRDMALAWSALRPGGVLLVDDVVLHPQVGRAFRVFTANGGAVLPTPHGLGVAFKTDHEGK